MSKLANRRYYVFVQDHEGYPQIKDNEELKEIFGQLNDSTIRSVKLLLCGALIHTVTRWGKDITIIRLRDMTSDPYTS